MRNYHIYVQNVTAVKTDDAMYYITEKPHFLCTVKGSKELYKFCRRHFHDFRWNFELGTDFRKSGESNLPLPSIVHIVYSDGTFVDYKTVTAKMHNYAMMKYYGKYSHRAYRYHYKCDISTPRKNPCSEDIDEALKYGIALKLPKKQDRIKGWTDDKYIDAGKSWKDQTKCKHQYEKNAP